MAKFSYSPYTDSSGAYFTYLLTELSYTWGSGASANNFTGNGYFVAGITSRAFVSGRTAYLGYGDPIIDTVVDGNAKVYPSTTETSFSGNTLTTSWFRLSASQYVYPFAAMCNSSGTYPLTMWGITPTGSVSDGVTHPGVYIQVASVVVRPANFYWSNYGTAPQNSKSVLYIPKATAWNGLRNNIVQLLVYKNYITSADSFYDSALPVVSSGTTITAAMYNQAVYYINSMHGGNYLAYVNKGTPMYGYYWYQLQYYINGIG